MKLSLLKLFSKRLRTRRTEDGKLVKARYDAAGYGPENRKHWSASDDLSADAAANYDVRKTLRQRARYEVENNSYAKGIVLTLANDTIGTGPRLQCLTDDETLNSDVEVAFGKWAEAIDLAGKLRIVRRVRAVDGEAFIFLVQNPKVRNNDVKLDLQLIEADQVTNSQSVMLEDEETQVDGIKLDRFGNPVSYHVLLHHPGGNYATNNVIDKAKDYPAENVIHYFRIDRPGQHRGIPEITSALPLFAQLRRFTLAVITAAESAADFAGIIYTDSPAGGESEDLAALDPIQLERNMLLTMPGGWKMGQLDSKQPCSTYGEFKNQILNEISRCLNMPFNIASGNSSGYNYASGRLDHQTYYKSIRVEQKNIVTRILDPIFRRWYREYAMATGKSVTAIPDHTWFWDGFEHVDPSKEANATATRLQNNVTTYAIEYAKQGRDWEDALRQRAKEKRLMKELGLTDAVLRRHDASNNEENEE